MKIHDITKTIQGEGFYCGELSISVLMTGCDLHCKFCDSKTIYEKTIYENGEINEIAMDIVNKAHKLKTDSIVISGGEPFVQKKDLISLVNLLPNRCKVTIETHGGLEIPKDFIETNRESIFLSISPKLKNSNSNYNIHTFDKNMMMLNKLKFWKAQLKYVVRDEDDIKEAFGMMSKTVAPKMMSIIFQPLAMPDDTVEDLLSKQRKINGFFFRNGGHIKYDVRILPQMNKLLYLESKEIGCE